MLHLAAAGGPGVPLLAVRPRSRTVRRLAVLRGAGPSPWRAGTTSPSRPGAACSARAPAASPWTAPAIRWRPRAAPGGPLRRRRRRGIARAGAIAEQREDAVGRAPSPRVSFPAARSAAIRAALVRAGSAARGDRELGGRGRAVVALVALTDDAGSSAHATRSGRPARCPPGPAR